MEYESCWHPQWQFIWFSFHWLSKVAACHGNAIRISGICIGYHLCKYSSSEPGKSRPERVILPWLWQFQRHWVYNTTRDMIVPHTIPCCSYSQANLSLIPEWSDFCNLAGKNCSPSTFIWSFLWTEGDDVTLPNVRTLCSKWNGKVIQSLHFIRISLLFRKGGTVAIKRNRADSLRTWCHLA